MSRLFLVIGFALVTASCQFDPARPPDRLALGEVCADDSACASEVCEATCVECRNADTCAGDDVCTDGRCTPAIVEVVTPAPIGGHVQTDNAGHRHRGRVAVPAVTTHRSTARGP